MARPPQRTSLPSSATEYRHQSLNKSWYFIGTVGEIAMIKSSNEEHSCKVKSARQRYRESADSDKENTYTSRVNQYEGDQAKYIDLLALPFIVTIVPFIIGDPVNDPPVCPK